MILIPRRQKYSQPRKNVNCSRKQKQGSVGQNILGLPFGFTLFRVAMYYLANCQDGDLLLYTTQSNLALKTSILLNSAPIQIRRQNHLSFSSKVLKQATVTINAMVIATSKLLDQATLLPFIVEQLNILSKSQYNLDLILVVHGISANQTSFFRYKQSQVQLSLYQSGSICQDLKFRGNFVKKANHLSRCAKWTLRNIEIVVSNFVTRTHGRYSGFKM